MVSICRTSQQDQLVASISQSVSKGLQHAESNCVEENVQSSFVPPSSVKEEHEKLQKFVLSIENSVALLDMYTYDSKLKKVSSTIIKIMKV